MKIYIDFSVFTEEGGAFGNVTGELDLAVVPQIGDSVSFAFSDKPDIYMPADFMGILTVTDRVIPLGGDGFKLQLSLSDVTTSTEDSGSELMSYFESAFGLFADIY